MATQHNQCTSLPTVLCFFEENSSNEIIRVIELHAYAGDYFDLPSKVQMPICLKFSYAPEIPFFRDSKTPSCFIWRYIPAKIYDSTFNSANQHSTLPSNIPLQNATFEIQHASSCFNIIVFPIQHSSSQFVIEVHDSTFLFMIKHSSSEFVIEVHDSIVLFMIQHSSSQVNIEVHDSTFKFPHD